MLTIPKMEILSQIYCDLIFNPHTSYGVLKRASNRLARTAITLEKPELFEIWDIPVCEISKYNTKDGSITVTFSNHIMPYLAQVRQKYVLYNLKEIANFGSLWLLL